MTDSASALNILHILSARNNVGETARVLQLAAAQLDAGHKVHLVLRRDTEVAERAKEMKLPHTCVNLGSRFHPLKEWSDIQVVRGLLAQQKVGIIHVHRGKDHWLGALSARGCYSHIPLVRTRHVIMPIKNHLANRWLYQSATPAIVCVSKAVEKSVQKSLPRYPGKVCIVPGTADNNLLQPTDAGEVARIRGELDIPDNALPVLMLARISFVKGHDHVLRAIPEIIARCPNALFIFAHSRQTIKWREHLEKIIADLDIAPAVRFIGAQKSIAPLLSLAEIGLIASVDSEGWSRAAVEYASSGLPTVATEVGSLPEIVDPEKTGLLVPLANSAGLSEAVCRLLEDEELRRKLGRAAKEKSRQYTLTAMQESIDALYHELLG